jgi:hypothetical protein
MDASPLLEYMDEDTKQVTADDLDLTRDSPSAVLAKIGLNLTVDKAVFYMSLFCLVVVLDVGRGIAYQLVLHDTLILSQSVVIMVTLTSVSVGLIITALNEGRAGLVLCADFRAWRSFSWVSMTFACCFSLDMLANVYLDAGMIRVIGQAFIPGAALLGYFFFGNLYTLKQWMTIGIIGVSAALFVSLGVKGDESGDIKTGACIALASCLLSVLASLLGEKYLKRSKDVPFNVQMVQMDIPALATVMLLLFLVPLVLQENHQVAYWAHRAELSCVNETMIDYDDFKVEMNRDLKIFQKLIKSIPSVVREDGGQAVESAVFLSPTVSNYQRPQRVNELNSGQRKSLSMFRNLTDSLVSKLERFDDGIRVFKMIHWTREARPTSLSAGDVLSSGEKRCILCDQHFIGYFEARPGVLGERPASLSGFHQPYESGITAGWRWHTWICVVAATSFRWIAAYISKTIGTMAKAFAQLMSMLILFVLSDLWLLRPVGEVPNVLRRAAVMLVMLLTVSLYILLPSARDEKEVARLRESLIRVEP